MRTGNRRVRKPASAGSGGGSKLYEFAPMLGPCEDHPVGSVEWAERISNRLQLRTQNVSRNTVPSLLEVLEPIWRAVPKPWEVWPKDRPFGTPDVYCKAVTGRDWESLCNLVQEFGGDLSEIRMRADLAIAQAKHRL